MKRPVLLSIVILLLITGCSTRKPLTESKPDSGQGEMTRKAVDFHDPSTWLLGYFAREKLTRPPHSEWFTSGYEQYIPDNEAISKLALINKDNLTIKIVMGSWCPDSRREVPRFMKIIDTWKFPEERISFIGVDDAKLSPVGEYSSLNIQRVPTFIFYKNNLDAGRIIEVPVTSLEQDIVNILSRE